jgi:N utilization substance protein A
MNEETANQIIMAARAHWFEGEDGPAEENGAEENRAEEHAAAEPAAQEASHD